MLSPSLTVVMPVFNGERYLNEAIDSILNQTFKDFEFIIINDGSRDKSAEIIKSYNDTRIRFFNNEENLGVAYCRNLGIQEAKGAYLAWCDCDDISMPDRFSRQIKFLEKNKTIGGCGSWLLFFKDNKSKYIQKVDHNPEILKAQLLFKPSIPNATVMLRMSEIKKYNLKYNNNLKIAEDYDFILRCSKHFDFNIIHAVLYKYRDNATSIVNTFNKLNKESLDNHKVVYGQALKPFNINPTYKEFELHRSISSQKLFTSYLEYKKSFCWLAYLNTMNNKYEVYNKILFSRVVSDQFYFISKKASMLGLVIFKFYVINAISRGWLTSPYNVFKLFARCIIKYNKF